MHDLLSHNIVFVPQGVHWFDFLSKSRNVTSWREIFRFIEGLALSSTDGMVDGDIDSVGVALVPLLCVNVTLQVNFTLKKLLHFLFGWLGG